MTRSEAERIIAASQTPEGDKRHVKVWGKLDQEERVEALTALVVALQEPRV